MKILKKFLCAGLALLATSFVVAGANNLSASANTTEPTETVTTFQLKNGASVRKVSPGGIRFITQLPKEQYVESATYGTLIIPTDKLGENALTFDLFADATLKDYVTNIVAEEWLKNSDSDNVWEYTGVIVNKDNEGNLIDLDERLWNRSLTAVGYYYVEDTASAVYTANPQTRSLAQTASLALQAGETSDTLTGIVDKVLTNNADGLAFGIANGAEAGCFMGDTMQLSLCGNEGLTAVWSSSAPEVATVDKNGLVTPVGLGTATITATIGTTTATVSFTVTDTLTLSFASGATDTIAPTDSMTLALNGSFGMTADWVSDNTDVATVENGVVTGVANGTANITATIKGFSATIAVTVDSRLPISGTEYAFGATKNDTTYYATTPVASTRLYTAQNTASAFKFEKAPGADLYYIYYETEEGNAYLGHKGTTEIDVKPESKSAWKVDTATGYLYSTVDTARIIALSENCEYFRLYKVTETKYAPAVWGAVPTAESFKVAETMKELGTLELPTEINENYSATLPTAGTANTDVAITWELTNDGGCATVNGGAFALTMPEESTAIQLKATVSCGDSSASKTFDISVIVLIKSPEEIVNSAYELAVGESLSGTYTLTGVITSKDGYGNPFITIGELTDKPIQCYKLTGEGKDLINVGDTITVKGSLMRYSETVVEFASGCELISYDVLPANQVAIEKDALSIVTNIEVSGEIVLPAAKYFSDVTITWAEECDFAEIVGDKLIVSKPSASTSFVVTATLTNGDAEETKEFTISVSTTEYVFSRVETPVAGKAYYMYATVDSTNYYISEVATALKLTTDISEALAITLVATDTENVYYLSYGETAKYITLTSNGTNKFAGKTAQADAEAWTLDLEKEQITLPKYLSSGNPRAIALYTASGSTTPTDARAYYSNGSYPWVWFGEMVELTDEARVAEEKAALTLQDEIEGSGEITLPTANNQDITIEWATNSTYATVVDGKLVVTAPFETTTVTVTATLTLNDVVVEKEFSLMIIVKLETPEEILTAAYALPAGQDLPGEYTLTGKITSVDTEFNPSYGNVTVTIVIDDLTTMPVQCYRLKGNGADVIKVGDTITVTGTFTNYGGTIELKEGCTLDSYTQTNANKVATELAKVTIPATMASGDTVDLYQPTIEGVTITYTLTATTAATLNGYTLTAGTVSTATEISLTAVVECDAASETKPLTTTIAASGVEVVQEYVLDFAVASNRTAYSTQQQVWEANGVKLTNDKGSGSNIGNYTAPVRFYKNSKVTIERTGMKMKKIVFNCNSTAYATYIKDSITADSNTSVSVDGKVVTVEFTNAVDSFVIAAISAATRVDSLTVYAV